jgi:thiol-disulfide isomerase/thioredoxin
MANSSLAVRSLKSASAMIPRSQCIFANYRKFHSSSRRTKCFPKADIAVSSESPTSYIDKRIDRDKVFPNVGRHLKGQPPKKPPETRSCWSIFMRSMSPNLTNLKLLTQPGSSSWCGPCKLLSPILEKITTDPEIKSGTGLPLDLVTVDTDDPDGFELGQKFKVRIISPSPSLSFGLVGSHILGSCAAYCVRVPKRGTS